MRTSVVTSRPQGRFLLSFLLNSFNFSARGFFTALVFVCAAVSAHAAVVRGTVTDRLGAAVRGAHINLVQDGKVVTSVVSGYDGSFELTTATSGRFVVTGIGTGFGLAISPEFYTGRLNVVTENIVLKPASVNDEVTVVATGVPTPAAQLTGTVDVINADSLKTRVGIVDDLRLMTGVNVVQGGETGSVTSVFVRGGQSTANKVLIDGMPANDIGGRFDFGTVSTTGLERVEVERGPGSAEYGADATASALNFVTPRGLTATPVLNYSGDAGDYHSWRNEVTLGGTWAKLDYFGGFSRFDTSNALQNDRYHDGTYVANLGYTVGSLQARATLRYSVSKTGVPGSIDFAGGVVANANEGDQDLYTTGVVEHRTAGNWHNVVRYGIAQKREQSQTFSPVGTAITVPGYYGPSTNYYGNLVQIHGANGYVTPGGVNGRAVLYYSGTTYPYRADSVSNKNEFAYETDFHFTPHHAVYGSFRYDNETGAYRYPAYAIVDNIYRTNFEYTLLFTGDLWSRVFYTIGSGLVKNHVFGEKVVPQFGLAYYPVRPGAGLFHGTKMRFNFSKGVQEADIFTELESLRNLLTKYGDPTDAAKVPQVGAQTTRAYEGGVDQSIWSQKLLAKATFFHNEYGNQAEFVSSSVIKANYNLPQAAVTALNSYYYGAYINTLAYRSMGAEFALEWKPLANLFLRGGYTYLDSVTQNSYSSSSLAPTTNPAFPGVQIGANGPLKGARPFRRPPHTGYLSVEYAAKRWTDGLKVAMASRADDSTFLAYDDLAGGNSLLLPNRNLDYGFVKLDIHEAYQLTPRVGFFLQLDNLLNNQHIAPIGYSSMPATFRLGVKVRVGGK
jgi:iron complex outermembrane receptor protein/vitamin B12 transporter